MEFHSGKGGSLKRGESSRSRKPMRPIAHNIRLGRRVLFALFVLLSGAGAPAVRLTLPEPVACNMACCLRDGACCCARSRLAVFSKQGSDAELSGRRPVEIITRRLTSSCPEQCAQVPAGASFQSIAKARLAQPAIVNLVKQTFAKRAMHVARDAQIDASAAPRAPPATFL